MPRRDFSLTIALCVSLIAHAMGLYWLIRLENASYASERGILRHPIQITAADQLRSEEARMKPIAPPTDPTPEFTMIQAPPPPPPKPAAIKPPEENYNHSDFGESTGKGNALNSIDGDKPMQARKGPQNQALLSKEPAGKSPSPLGGEGGVRGEPPQPKTPSLPSAASPPVALTASPPRAAQPAQLAQSLVEAHPGKDAPDLLAQGPTPATQTAEEEVKPVLAIPARAAVAPVPRQVAIATPPHASVAPTQQPQGPGDVPAPLSDTDSDAFSTTGSIEFHPGHTEARFGRKVKATRPRLTLAGGEALLSLGPGASVVLKVRFDDTGHVTKVDILRTSGSSLIDQPCQVAVYDWWFEPTKDKAGKPKGDVIVFSIGFY